MFVKLLVITFIFNLSIAHGQMSDDAPPDFSSIDTSAKPAVTENARKAVEMARKVFKEAYAKANDRYAICKPDHFNKVADCILAGVLYNYALNYGSVIGHTEDFSRSVHAEDQNSNFDVEANMLSEIMNNINWLKDNGYYFLKDGTIRIPGSTVKVISLKDFADPTKLVGATKLTAAEVTEINSILATIAPSTPTVTVADVAPTGAYEVVDATTVAPVPPMDERTIASLNVTYKTDPIAIALADIFVVINEVYATVAPTMLP